MDAGTVIVGCNGLLSVRGNAVAKPFNRQRAMLAPIVGCLKEVEIMT